MWRNLSSLSSNSSQFECYQMFDYKTVTVLGSIFETSLILPLALCVLYFGYQRWKPLKSFKSVTHSEFFTYNMALTQLLAISGNLAYLSGVYISSDALKRAGMYMYGPHLISELLFHSLTCVDRYLAVVKPTFYLKLKQRLGFVVRNVFTSVVWTLHFGHMGLESYYYPNYPVIVFVCTVIVTFQIVSFCSVSVLCILTRPGPGGQKKINQTKLKAFHTIVAIMVVILIWLLGMLAWILVGYVIEVNYKVKCVLFEVIMWLSLPSSMVLLLLYLQKTVKCAHSK